MDGEKLVNPAKAHDHGQSDGVAVTEDMIRADSFRADVNRGNTDHDSITAAEIMERARHAAIRIGSRAAHGVGVGMHALRDPDTRRKVATTVGAGAAVVASGAGAVAGARRVHSHRQPAPPANFYSKVRGMVNEKLN